MARRVGGVDGAWVSASPPARPSSETFAVVARTTGASLVPVMVTVRVVVLVPPWPSETV
jgi:hypothetical protein